MSQRHKCVTQNARKSGLGLVENMDGARINPAKSFIVGLLK